LPTKSVCNRVTIAAAPNLLGLHKSGHLKLDEIITRRHSLEQVNDGDFSRGPQS
jgi:Zn-dependent alcohol dehydrogenase